jgi:DNA-directed RNA polymerase specialized sigma24 family protein
VRPWLLRIVRNLVRDRARRLRVRRTESLEPADDDALRFEPRDDSPDPEALASRRELQALVWKCLQELHPRYREVVMSRLHRARRLLQEEVRKHRSGTGEARDG